MGSFNSNSDGRIINNTQFTLQYTIKSYDMTTKKQTKKNKIDGKLAKQSYLGGGYQIQTQFAQTSNESTVFVSSFQQTTQGLTIIQGQRQYISIYINGQILMESASIYKVCDCSIYVYVQDNEIRWKNVPPDYQWERHYDNDSESSEQENHQDNTYQTTREKQIYIEKRTQKIINLKMLFPALKTINSIMNIFLS